MSSECSTALSGRYAPKKRESWIEGKCCPWAAGRAWRRLPVAPPQRLDLPVVAARAADLRRRAADAADRRHERNVPAAPHYCIGRNYAAHSREKGSDPNREPPFFFQKPSDAIQFVAPRHDGRPSLSEADGDHHYEIELVAALGRAAATSRSSAPSTLVYGYTIGLDMTRRDLQRAMGDEKKPWEIGKSFDRSAPMGPLHRVADVGHLTQGAIMLKVNGVIKQSADLSSDDLERRRAYRQAFARPSS